MPAARRAARARSPGSAGGSSRSSAAERCPEPAASRGHAASRGSARRPDAATRRSARGAERLDPWRRPAVEPEAAWRAGSPSPTRDAAGAQLQRSPGTGPLHRSSTAERSTSQRPRRPVRPMVARCAGADCSGTAPTEPARRGGLRRADRSAGEPALLGGSGSPTARRRLGRDEATARRLHAIASRAAFRCALPPPARAPAAAVALGAERLDAHPHRVVPRQTASHRICGASSRRSSRPETSTIESSAQDGPSARRPSGRRRPRRSRSGPRAWRRASSSRPG